MNGIGLGMLRARKKSDGAHDPVGRKCRCRRRRRRSSAPRGFLTSTEGQSPQMRALEASPSHREAWAETLLDRLTPFMSALSVVFLLVVLGEQFARPGSAMDHGLTAAGWVLWTAFCGEFLVRLLVAPHRSQFLRRNWWQVLFLILPFLRFFRLVRAVRILRTGRVVSSAVRSTRTAQHVLGGRVAWLSVMSAIIVMSTSQLLYAFSGYTDYGDALHAAALATISGEPLGMADPFSRTVEVVLAIYSVVVFATLAGSLGAFFMETRTPRNAEERPPDHAHPS